MEILQYKLEKNSQEREKTSIWGKIGRGQDLKIPTLSLAIAMGPHTKSPKDQVAETATT